MAEVADVPPMDQLQDLADHLDANPRPNMGDFQNVADGLYDKREAQKKIEADYKRQHRRSSHCATGELTAKKNKWMTSLNRMEEVFPGSSVEERLAYAMLAVKQVKTMTDIASKMEPGV